MSGDLLSGIATTISAFGGAAVGGILTARVTRKGDRELDVWRRREESLRLIRWATDLATDSDDAHSMVGVRVLTALWDAEIFQPEDEPILQAVVAVIVEGPVAGYPDLGGNPPLFLAEMPEEGPDA